MNVFVSLNNDYIIDTIYTFNKMFFSQLNPWQELAFCSWSSISDNNGLLDETFHIFFRLRPLHSLILLEKESVCLSKCSFRLLFTVIWCFFGIDIWYWFLSIILLMHVLDQSVHIIEKSFSPDLKQSPFEVTLPYDNNSR